MKKLLFILLFFSPLALLSQNKIVIKSTQVTISSLAPIAANTVVANATGGIATPTAVQLGVGITFSAGKLAIDTANFKDTIYAMGGLSMYSPGFNRIGLGGFLSQNVNISGSNVWDFTIDSMQANVLHGFRVNFGSDAGWDMIVRDSATGRWTRIPKGVVGQALIMLGSGGIGWGAVSGGGGGSGGIGVDSVQSYASGTTLTQTAGFNYIQVNPATAQAALTITTATTFHTSNDLYIVFGGTVTSGNPVITSFSVTAGAGLTLVQEINPNGLTYSSGEVIHYHKIGSFLYRIN